MGVLCAAIACDATPGPDAGPAAPSTAIDAPREPDAAAVAPSDPSPPVDRTSALVALETLAAPDGKPRCAACSSDAALTLLVAASLDDEAIRESLRDLDAMVRFYADDGLAGVLVLAATAHDPPIGPAIDRALALRDRLRLAMDVRVPARPDAVTDAAWLADGPHVVLVGRDGRVTFAAAATPRERWSALDRAIVDALAREGGTKSPIP